MVSIKNYPNLSNYKLCYVDDNFAYFTNKSLTEQWGDDWDDAPYEHNAGTPYCDEKDQIFKIAIETDLRTPNDGYFNSPYSVQDINNGAAAWLYDRWGKSGIAIHAGCLVIDFIERIQQSGGKCYFEICNIVK